MNEAGPSADAGSTTLSYGQEVAPKPMLDAVAAAQARMSATRAAKLEEVYGDQAQASPDAGGRR